MSSLGATLGRTARYGTITVGAAALLSMALSAASKSFRNNREVYLVGSSVELGSLRISKPLHDFISSKFGFSLEAVSHWGVVVRDNSDPTNVSSTQYDLWSATAPKNELRHRLVTKDISDAYTCLQSGANR